MTSASDSPSGAANCSRTGPSKTDPSRTSPSRSSPVQQLPLPVLLNQEISFDNFYGGVNQKNVVILQQALSTDPSKCRETLIYIVGPAAAGKTHLACAAMQFVERGGGRACYVAMDELRGVDLINEQPDSLFDGLEDFVLVVLDNIDAWLISAAREQALFNVFNRFKITGQQLMLTARTVPAYLKVELPDLSSRLNSGLLLSLVTLDDLEKQRVLIELALQKGLVLADEVAAYILKRSGRNMAQLTAVLATLDRASLVEQRRLTVPFVKKVLHW